MVQWKRKRDFGSAFLSPVTAENPHIPFPWPATVVLILPSRTWWVVHPKSAPGDEKGRLSFPKKCGLSTCESSCSLQACPGLPFTCLWRHCAQNSNLPWDAVDSAREQNEFSLAFLQSGGKSKALSEPRVYRTETWSSSATGALFAACRKLLQGRAALRINSKPFLLTKQIKSTGEREGSCV